MALAVVHSLTWYQRNPCTVMLRYGATFESQSIWSDGMVVVLWQVASVALAVRERARKDRAQVTGTR